MLFSYTIPVIFLTDGVDTYIYIQDKMFMHVKIVYKLRYTLATTCIYILLTFIIRLVKLSGQMRVCI